MQKLQGGGAKIAPKSSDNHHYNHHNGVSDETPHQRLMRLYQDALGYRIPHGGKEGAAAKKILSSHYLNGSGNEKHYYTPDDAIGCYQWMKQKPFWRDKHLSLQTVFQQMGQWVLQGRPGGQEENKHTTVEAVIKAVKQMSYREASEHLTQSQDAAWRQTGLRWADLKRMSERELKIKLYMALQE